MKEVKEITTKRLDIALEGGNLIFSYKGDDNQNIFVVSSSRIEGVYILNSDEETTIEVKVEYSRKMETLSFEVTDLNQKELNEVVKFLQGFVD